MNRVLDVQDLMTQKIIGHQLTTVGSRSSQRLINGNKNEKNNGRMMLKERQKLMMNQKTVVHHLAQN